MTSNMSYASSSMINGNLEGYCTDLPTIHKSFYGVPLVLFSTKNSTLANDIANAIEYLKEVKNGAVRIPANADNQSNYNSVLIVSSINRHDFTTNINYTTSNYTHPTTGPRPYTNDNWRVGDIVNNNDFTINNYQGWVCIKEGSPGTWEPFGYHQNFQSSIEVVTALPDANMTNLGRVVDLNHQVYSCVKFENAYSWILLSGSQFGTTSNRPTDLSVGLTYYNTDNNVVECYTGSQWVSLLSLDTSITNILSDISSIKTDISNIKANISDIYTKINK